MINKPNPWYAIGGLLASLFVFVLLILAGAGLTMIMADHLNENVSAAIPAIGYVGAIWLNTTVWWSGFIFGIAHSDK